MGLRSLLSNRERVDERVNEEMSWSFGLVSFTYLDSSAPRTHQARRLTGGRFYDSQPFCNPTQSEIFNRPNSNVFFFLMTFPTVIHTKSKILLKTPTLKELVE